MSPPFFISDPVIYSRFTVHLPIRIPSIANIHSFSSFHFFWSIYDNEARSAEAFQGHPLLFMIVSESLRGKFTQEEVTTCSTIVWDSGLKYLSY
jgi:hypothetical protein